MLRATPRIGLWLDTSDQSAEESVDAIVARALEAQIQAPPNATQA